MSRLRDKFKMVPMAEISGPALTFYEILTMINSSYCRAGPNLNSHSLTKALKGELRSRTCCAQAENINILSAPRYRTLAGLLHLVCIPQPPQGSGSWKIPPFVALRVDEGRDKGRDHSNSVELTHTKKVM